MHLSIKDLSVELGRKKVLDSISIDIADNGIYGVIGPNGAGKTTLLRAISTGVEHSKGRISANGRETPEGIRELTGSYTSKDRLYKELSLRENLDFISEIKNCGYDKWVKEFGLQESLDKKFEDLSSGKQKLAYLTKALMGEPPLVLIDEPFSSLDAAQKERLFALLEKNSESQTIIMATHQLETAEAICARVFMLINGKKTDEGKPKELMDRFGKNVYMLESEEIGTKHRMLGKGVAAYHEHMNRLRIHTEMGLPETERRIRKTFKSYNLAETVPTLRDYMLSRTDGKSVF